MPKPVPRRILIVDDSEPLRKMLEQIINDHGYEADGVASGEEALTLQRNATEPYIAVLLDLTLPAMDGAATLLALRDAGMTAPVILMSGVENSRMLSRMSPEHYAQFLQKPLNAESIIRTIRKVVRRSRET